MRTRTWIALALGALALDGCGARVAPATPDADVATDAAPAADVVVDDRPPSCVGVRSDTGCQAMLEWQPGCPVPEDIDFRTTGEQDPAVCARHCPALTGAMPLSCQGFRGHGTSFLACRRCP